jgi:hypothetical protein
MRKGSRGEAMCSHVYETEAALTLNQKAVLNGGSSQLMITLVLYHAVLVTLAAWML